MPVPFWRRVRTGIRGRILFLMLLILLPAFTIQAYFFYDRYQFAKAQEFQANREVAHMVAGGFESFIQEVHLQELAIGISLSASPPLSTRDVNRLLLESDQDYPSIQSFSWAGVDGRIEVSSTSWAVGKDISPDPYFREMVSGREWVVSDVFRSTVTGEPVFVIGRAIRGEQGNFLGAVLAEVLADRLDGVLAVRRPGHGSISLVDSSGRLVYRHPPAVITWDQRDWKASLPSIREMYHQEYAGVLIPPYDSHHRIMVTKPIQSIGWFAVACSREDEAMRPVIGSLTREGILFLVVALTSFLAALVLSRSISGPIKGLQRHAASLSRGDLETRVPLRGPSELQDLAAVFNQMAGQIRTWTEKAEQRAVEAEEEKRVLDALMEHVPEGIAIADAPDVRIRRMSRYGRYEAGEIPEITEKAPLSHYFRKGSILHLDGKTALDSDELPLARAVKKGEVTNDLELILRRRDGSESVLLCNAGPIRNSEGQVTGGVVAWRDITERKRMEDDLRSSRDELEQRVRQRTAELERANEALRSEIRMRERAESDLEVHAAKLELSNREMQDFVFVASHDLQEPARKLQTLADVFSLKCRDSLSDECLDYVDRIRMAAKRMQDLLSSLLAYSHIATKPEQFIQVDLTEAARDAISSLEEYAAQKGGTIEVGELPVMEGDRLQMVRLFQDIVHNALKFHREGVPPEVKIQSGYVEGMFGPGGYAISVQDNGIGFEERYRDRIFLPFERLHGREPYEGVGMGLTICRKIVERHNGSIRVKSSPGKGSTFIILIPVKQK
jgi:signal transduction histidine kinase